jgi:hypothetical protein
MVDRLPPTPRGYSLIPVSGPNGREVVWLLSCNKCGGLVLMHQTHTDWHKKNG